MIAALIRKELRELAPFAILAALVQLYILACVTRVSFGPQWSTLRNFLATDNDKIIPFVSSESHFTAVFYLGLALGATLALRQTLWESGRGTFHFLLHRPLARTTIFAVKLLIGAGLCLLITIVPVACYALWAATSGTHATPFRWSMTAWAWQASIVVPQLYFGAFLSGLRPARWFGSRLLPLFGATVLALVLSEINGSLKQSCVVAAIVLATTAAWIVAILYVARERDFS